LLTNLFVHHDCTNLFIKINESGYSCGFISSCCVTDLDQ
jgi:hypothetical protein